MEDYLVIIVINSELKQGTFMSTRTSPKKLCNSLFTYNIFNEESFVTYDVIFTKVLHIGNIIYTNNHAIYKNLKLVKSQKSKTVSHADKTHDVLSRL